MENQTFTCWLQWLTLGRAPWPCGLVRHVLDWEIRGWNLGGGSQYSCVTEKYSKLRPSEVDYIKKNTVVDTNANVSYSQIHKNYHFTFIYFILCDHVYGDA